MLHVIGWALFTLIGFIIAIPDVKDKWDGAGAFVLCAALGMVWPVVLTYISIKSWHKELYG
jgi:hypothetical protein